ncbi:hypothetical protein VHEMI08889 [[Torrubiella] hemipterigena]|uniref:Killer toxin Kp4 domain-containing protein n=1 Tax=[Torrubiella] hemipterigena TaxID=1531966 RepID=A0A0A1TP18_9HYPO|nr:hypothetical protein VHEMI08889 [[Torrubiella] hemipterigena]
MHTANILILTTAIVAETCTALGINCRGSGLCLGNNGILGNAQNNLRAMDPNQRFTDGQHITCVRASSPTHPFLCIFYQNTGRSWTVSQTIDHVQNLIDHECFACGSDPTDPGNDVKHGQLTANMVVNARRGMDQVLQVRTVDTRDVTDEKA